MNKYLEEGLIKSEYIFLQIFDWSMISRFYKPDDRRLESLAYSWPNTNTVVITV